MINLKFNLEIFINLRWVWLYNVKKYLCSDMRILLIIIKAPYSSVIWLDLQLWSWY